MRNAVRVIGRPSLVTVVALAAAACSDDSDRAGDGPGSTHAAQADVRMTEWVAVFRVEPYPEAARRQFIREAGRFIFEGPAACFDGLGPLVGGSDRSVMGLVAGSEPELQAALTMVNDEPLVTGEFASNCID